MGKNIGIVLAGGIGHRFGGDKPKQYFMIKGKEMIAYSIELFRTCKTIDDFVVVLNQDEFENGRIAVQYGVRTICGGKTRNWSFKNALDYIAKEWPDCEKIIENNAACPLTKPETIDEYIHKLDEYDWVQTTIKITDALGSYRDRTVNRDDFFLIQAPDAYRFKMLYDSFNPDHPNGHPAVQLPPDAKGYNAFYDGRVFKVTHPDDIKIIEAVMGKIGRSDSLGNESEMGVMITREKFLEPEIRDGVEVSAEMKAVWKVLLDILEEFIRICEKYNLKYCLDGGTMLGAIRHKGFIPWDDDVDVSLPRADFQRFLEVAKDELKPPLFLQYGTTDPEHFQAFACIRNNQTSAIDEAWIRDGKRYSMGIGMDVFPFDYVPDSRLGLRRMLWRNKQILRLYCYVFSHTLRGWRKWIVRPCFILLYKLIGNDRLIKWRDRNLAAYTEEEASRYGNIAFQLGNERGLFRKGVFKNRIKVPFEYIEAYVPGGYEEYLKHLYGVNWRTPIRGVCDHNPLVIDTKQSYKKLLVERFGYKKEWVWKLP